MHFLWKSLSFRLAAAPGREAASPRSTAPTPQAGKLPRPLPPSPNSWHAGLPSPSHDSLQ